MTRSPYPSALKSPAPRDRPNRSPSSALSFTPGLSCDHSWSSGASAWRPAGPLALHADGQVRVAVSVEVGGGQGPAEPVSGLGVVLDARAVLRPQLVVRPPDAIGLEAQDAAVQDLHGARVRLIPDLLELNAYGQIVVSVGVEVTGLRAEPEVVARVRLAQHPVLALVPELVVRYVGLQAPGASVQDVDRPGVQVTAADVLEDRADGDVLESVAVEVGGGLSCRHGRGRGSAGGRSFGSKPVRIQRVVVGPDVDGAVDDAGRSADVLARLAPPQDGSGYGIQRVDPVVRGSDIHHPVGYGGRGSHPSRHPRGPRALAGRTIHRVD